MQPDPGNSPPEEWTEEIGEEEQAEVATMLAESELDDDEEE